MHNVGVITNSDAAKLRLLTKSAVQAPKVLAPTAGDLWSVKVFMDETASWVNDRVADRLCELVTTIYNADASLFDAAKKAGAIAAEFGKQAIVAGAIATPP